MTFDEYQQKAHYTSGNDSLEMCALGLNGESGEVADLIKRHKYHGHTLVIPKLEEELGDVLWYIAEMATTLGLSLESVAWANVQKLQQRYPEGFSSKWSINRQPSEATNLPAAHKPCSVCGITGWHSPSCTNK